MNAEPLPRIEWDFGNVKDVPDTDLIACCLWEYARESQYMRTGIKRLISEWPRSERRQHKQFWDRIGDCDPIVESIVTGNATPNFLPIDDPRTASFPNPWQTLSPAERTKRSDKALPESFYKPFQKAYWFDTIFVAKKVEQEVKKQKAKRPRKPFKLKHTNIIYDGKEVASFQIAWKEFSNARIKAAFGEWVDHNRPKMIPEPKASAGHKPIDWRKKLRDLGVMRLMNFSTVAGMRVRCPEAARCYENWESKHWSAARKRALNNFRTLFPFLPKNELPLHAATKGGRAKL